MSMERVGSVVMSTAQGAGDDFNSGQLDIRGLQCFSIQVVWADLDDSDGEVVVQFSNDGTNWSDDTASNVVLTSASGNEIFNYMIGSACNYARISYSAGGNTEGTLSITGTRVEEVNQ